MSRHRYLWHVKTKQRQLRSSVADSRSLSRQTAVGGLKLSSSIKQSGSLFVGFLAVAFSSLTTTTLADSVLDSAEQQAHTVIEKHCFSCHGSSEISGLDLRYRDKILKGGKRGPAVIPGNAAKSLLFQSVSGQSELRMPPGKNSLTEGDLRVLSKWINEGAHWPTSEPTIAQAAREILEKHCLECHGASQMSDLDLRQRDTMLRGGKRGPAVVPGNAAKSLLFQAVAHEGELKMPMGRAAISKRDLAVLEQWIGEGAAWTSISAEMKKPGPSWWSFKKIQKPEIPQARNGKSGLNPIDAFVLAKMEQKGLKVGPPADKRTLLRRTYFDLIGLPPTPKEMDEFLKKDSPNAYEKVVDDLLASPRYGERWARYWLDVVRYADSAGFEGDVLYPNAWRYRDYVIKSFNDDKPYDRFVQEQIAGDELWPDNLNLQGFYDIPLEKLEHLEARIGTSLYTFGPETMESNLDAVRLSYERLTDAVDTTGAAFLGLTFGCARCHDHKFDPIPQKDYFRLQAVFAASSPVQIPVVTGMSIGHRDETYAQMIALDEVRLAYRIFEKKVKDRVIESKEKGFPVEALQAFRTPPKKRSPREADLAAPVDKFYTTLKIRDWVTDEERTTLERLYRNLGDAVLNVPSKDPSHSVQYDGFFDVPSATVLGPLQPELIPDVYVLDRGDLGKNKAKVAPGLPGALTDDEDSSDLASRGPRYRKELALWLTRPDHPLTARVIVNRIWQGHFGVGIASTANDMGRQGQSPSHPELLDWLASEFVRQGWSIKSLHRLIMLSETYQRDSRFVSVENSRIDPDNIYLWRMNRRRLEAEAVWDSIHAVAGNLNLKMGGRAIMPPISKSEMTALRQKDSWVTPADPAEANRRGIYILSRRNFMFPLFDKFDMPNPATSCSRREITTVAPQVLWTLNNQISYGQAEEFASRLVKEQGNNPPAWVEAGWSLALGRHPRPEESRQGLDLINTLASNTSSRPDGDPLDPVLAELGPARASALIQFCLTIFNLNEFVYID